MGKYWVVFFIASIMIFSGLFILAEERQMKKILGDERANLKRMSPTR